MTEERMSAREYAVKWSRNQERSYLARVGRRATALCRARGVEPGLMTGVPQSGRKLHQEAAAAYRVGTYPVAILEQAFREVRP
jgi:hypothetical protein